MSVKLLDDPAALVRRRQFDLFDDFLSFTDTQLWTKTDGDAGASVAIDADGVGGIVDLTTGATDNNEAYLATTNELFKFADDKPLTFETRIKFTEANTDDANVMVGLMDAVGANSILNNGGGPKASFSGAVIYKVDGETAWKFQTSIGTTKTTTVSDLTAGGAWQTLRIVCIPVTSTKVECVPFVDEVGGSDFKQLRDANGNLIKHTITLGSETEMDAAVGVKAGGGNSEVVNLDYIGCSQLR